MGDADENRDLTGRKPDQVGLARERYPEPIEHALPHAPREVEQDVAREPGDVTPLAESRSATPP
ncbi:hypothetical protein [Sorangium cellulosum]|uniref:Uncharacterized protein n=1 Tax=Sorangium cellulosum TaxID=56 RepID=A0A150QDH7_SORCE|nr:hypothetical protein [Sorangium cellulosum]KYF65963.1 hypothetical protein BE15_03885 [Sorangium cellulosum]